jgi:tRNA threonylcarbamoyladenosine biosynthesis protein TsaE
MREARYNLAVVKQSTSVEQTETIASALAGTLTGGECVALHGELGAGKTQFVRGLLRGLGGEPRSVSSATFVLLHVYDTGRLPVMHLDAYRVAGPEEFESIGFGELLEEKGVVIVEWADRVSALIPREAIHVTLRATGRTRREITIERRA